MGYDFTFNGAALTALGTGALWWRDESLLCVSDLHLGKSERIARLGGAPLPPYETTETLNRLDSDLAKSQAKTVICLGDSFDDSQAASALSDHHKDQIALLQSGRTWVWIKGNHDPNLPELGGSHLHDYHCKDIVFRHIAHPDARAEISGHYHPKSSITTRGRRITRPAFLWDQTRIILPAYGTYTGGLHSGDAILTALMSQNAIAILTGPTPVALPMVRKSGR